MGTTTFTGPIKAGPILNTSGNTVGVDVADVGTCLLTQISPVTQAASAGQAAGVYATSIVIPANSTIVSIAVLETVAWNGAAATFSVGTSATATELAVGVDGATIGLTTVTPGADATRVGKWVTVGATDVRIWVKSANTGAGVGVIAVSYVQAPNNS